MLDEGVVQPDNQGFRWKIGDHGMRGEFATQFAKGCLDEISGIMPVQLRAHCPRFESSDVEQVSHDAVESAMGLKDFGQESAALLGFPVRMCIEPISVAQHPVIRVDRPGAQTGVVAKAFVYRTPSAASRSRFGVGTVSSP